MEKFDGQEPDDIASYWVQNLRSRFAKLGLPSESDSEIGKESTAFNDRKPAERTHRIRSNFSKRGSVCEKDPNSSPGKNATSPSASAGDEFPRISNILIAEGGSNVDFPEMNDTARSDGTSLPDLEMLRQKRLFHFQGGIPSESLKPLHSHKYSTGQELSLESDRPYNVCPQTATTDAGDVFQEEFYTRPRRLSSTGCWEKNGWDCNRFDQVQTPETDYDKSPVRSKEDNVDLMLDWWGLNNQSVAPELHKYLPDSMKAVKSSCTVSDNTQNFMHFNSGYKSAGTDTDSKDAFHVFPVGFDQDEHELGKSEGKCAMPEGFYNCSDEDLDFTLDDPVSKRKSQKFSDGVLQVNSTADPSPRSWQSASPPEPQIKGSLYHPFYAKENSGTSTGIDAPDSNPVSNSCTTPAESDKVVNLRLPQRPRSLSQPSTTKDCCEQYSDVFGTLKKGDPSIKMVCSFVGQPEGTAVLRCKSRRNSVDDFEEVSIENSEEKVDGCSMGETKLSDSVDSFVPTVSMCANVLVEHVCDKPIATKSDCISTTFFCPECGEINSTSANWCFECGLALVGVSGPYTSLSNIELTQDSRPRDFLLHEKSASVSCPDGKNSRKDYKQDTRHWEKSSLAWNTFKDNHLSKPPGTKNFKHTSGFRRPRSASFRNSGRKGDWNPHNKRNFNGTVGSWPKSCKMREFTDKKRNICKLGDTKDSELRVKGERTAEAKMPVESTKNGFLSHMSSPGDFAEITQTIRSNQGDVLSLMCLPDEIILRIFSHLPHTDLARCSQVCQQLYTISQDKCLWKTIVLRRKPNMCDEILEKIGSRKPVSLSLIKCRGNGVTSVGLRELFRRCAENLEELNFSACNGGQLIGESILLHVALRCNKLRSVDASWSNVGDNGVEALVQNVDRLECLCLNGCQAVTDHSLKVIADKHGASLRTFEIFGCFNVSAAGIKRLGQNCRQLQTLNLGQCYKITSVALGQLVSNLELIVNLDLRGCKQARDGCVKTIAHHCPLLVNLVLANCPLITDVAMAEIASNLPSVRCLDVCGCAKVTDDGVRALARSCNRLNYLDLSSTSITKKSVMLLANYCSQNLKSLKLSFCVDVTDDSVSRLVKHCKRMTTLHLYGCKRLRNVEALQQLNRSLKLEF